jgi:hypothetical protein
MNINAGTTCARMSETFVTYHSQVSALGLPLETLIKFNLNEIISIMIAVPSFNRGKGEKSDMKRETVHTSVLVPKKYHHSEVDTFETMEFFVEQLLKTCVACIYKNNIYYEDGCINMGDNKTILILIMPSITLCAHDARDERKMNELQESTLFCLVEKIGEMVGNSTTAMNEIFISCRTLLVRSLFESRCSTLVKNEDLMVRFIYLLFWLIVFGFILCFLDFLLLL